MTAGSAGDVLTFTFDNGVSATTVTLTNSAGSSIASLDDLVTELNGANAVSTGGSGSVTFSANNGTLQATFDQTGASQNSYTFTMGYDDNSGTDVTTATGVLVMAGRDAGDTTVFNDATFAVNTDGDLELYLHTMVQFQQQTLLKQL